MEHFEWFDPMQGRRTEKNGRGLEVIVPRKPRNPKNWPTGMPQEEIERRINAVCGCGGSWDCDCVSVFNKAISDAWYDHNTKGLSA